MIRAFLSMVLSAAIVTSAYGDPQYSCNKTGSGNYFPLGTPGGVGSKVQLLYKITDFGELPSSGRIRSIYFKNYPVKEFSGENCYTNVTIRIGVANTAKFEKGRSRFIEPLTTVFNEEDYRMDFSHGGWMEPILLKEPYAYENLSNLIIEISVGKASAVRFVSYSVLDETRRIWGVEGSDISTDGDGGLYAIGFDISPLQSVDVASVNNLSQMQREDADAPSRPGRLNNAKEMENRAPAEENRVSSKRSNLLLLAGVGLFTLLCMGVALPFLPRSQRLAYWALKNPGKTKLALLGSQLLTSAAGLILGKQLYDAGIVTTDTATQSLLAAATVGTLLYPKREAKKEFFGKAYRKQKLLSLFLAITGLGLVTSLGNRIAADKDFSPLASSAMLAVDKHYYDPPPNISYAAYTTASNATTQPISRGWNIALTVLSTIFMVALMVAICIGTCWLFCISEPVWAVILFVGGGGSVIYGYVMALRALRDQPGRPRVRRY